MLSGDGGADRRREQQRRAAAFAIQTFIGFWSTDIRVPMSEVQQVIVQIKKPRGDFPGQVVYGYYTLDNGFVRLTDRNGKPAGDETGRRYSRKLYPGEDVRAVACKMTKELRLALRGNSEPINGFEGKIQYPKMKCA
jgi:hypothetical protein